jgi:hypothetical protein
MELFICMKHWWKLAVKECTYESRETYDADLPKYKITHIYTHGCHATIRSRGEFLHHGKKGWMSSYPSKLAQSIWQNYMDAISFLLIITSLLWLADLQFLAHLLNKSVAFHIAPLTDLPYIMPINHILFEN